MSPAAEAVLAALTETEEPVRAKRLAAVVGVPWRQVVDAVRECRLAGHYVAATPGGYKLAETRAERTRTRAQLVGKLVGLREVIDALDAAHPEVVQLSLEV